MTRHYDNYLSVANHLIEYLDKKIIIGVPLGLGKPIGLLNALYQLAASDSSIELTIITGLTLARPSFKNELEKRFINPILDRILKDYENLLYEAARVAGSLPKNIHVYEFYLAPGVYLHNAYVQQHYISSNYSTAVRDTIYYSVNVLAQQVAPSINNKDEVSVSCNSDLFEEMREHLMQYQSQGNKIAIVAEINGNLPFMLGKHAVFHHDIFSHIVDTGTYRSLFALPKDELSPEDHLIGIYSSCLIKDDSCLQIGIGKLGNAISNALILRQKNNSVYQDILKKLAVQDKFSEILKNEGFTNTFSSGLYASTEMFSNEYLELYKANILKKKVYDHIGLQGLLNSKKITESITPECLDIFLEENIISAQLTQKDILFLKEFGIFKKEVDFNDGVLYLPQHDPIKADLNSVTNKQKIIQHCLGNHLKNGKILQAGFFIGSQDFYEQLKNFSNEEMQHIEMTTITRTNTLFWSYELAKLQRKEGRFINSSMMVTLLGASVSDCLTDLQEVSGVGGQFDFVYMAQKIPGARSIINCRSTRESHNKTTSNIVFEYPNATIPRHYRDIIITEYGIADCRSKSDAAVIQAILNITDSRFQQDLLNKAKNAKKIARDYEIPAVFRQNFPDKVEAIIQAVQSQGYCKPYPFGSDLTEDEKVLGKALLYLKNCSTIKIVSIFIQSLFTVHNENLNRYLLRMQLSTSNNLKELFYKKILQAALRNTA